jgi:hypothetical protein
VPADVLAFISASEKHSRRRWRRSWPHALTVAVKSKSQEITGL